MLDIIIISHIIHIIHMIGFPQVFNITTDYIGSDIMETARNADSIVITSLGMVIEVIITPGALVIISHGENTEDRRLRSRISNAENHTIKKETRNKNVAINADKIRCFNDSKNINHRCS